MTIGAYDGVHLGHQAVLAQVRALAEARGLATTVVTFDRHPATVVRPESAPKLLTDLGQKLDILADTGHVDLTVVLTFDQQRAAEEPEDFVVEVLVEALATRLVVVGEDFHFGHRRRGTVSLLAGLGDKMGFEVVGLGLVDGPGELGPLSSTAIRRHLEAGEVAAASALLGRPHEVRGVVVSGDRRGRLLGFPTANLSVSSELALPSAGIYAGWYRRPDGTRHATAMSLGWRPTFHGAGSPIVLEAYLLDFDGDLYGEAASVQFVERLHGEERFESAKALVAQMHTDVAFTRKVLGVS